VPRTAPPAWAEAIQGGSKDRPVAGKNLGGLPGPLVSSPPDTTSYGRPGHVFQGGRGKGPQRQALGRGSGLPQRKPCVESTLTIMDGLTLSAGIGGGACRRALTTLVVMDWRQRRTGWANRAKPGGDAAHRNAREAVSMLLTPATLEPPLSMCSDASSGESRCGSWSRRVYEIMKQRSVARYLPLSPFPTADRRLLISSIWVFGGDGPNAGIS